MDEEIQSFKITNNRFEKNIRLFKVLAIITGIAAVIKIISNPGIFSGADTLFDFGTMLLPIVIFFEYRRQSKHWGGQFIELADSELIYKTRQNKPTTIPLNSITNIQIKLDQIIIETTGSGEQTIIVEDFTNYSDRISIKSHFSELKKQLILT